MINLESEPSLEEHHQETIHELSRLRTFNGPPTEFWPRLLAAIGALTCASSTILISRKPNGEWRSLSSWSNNGKQTPPPRPDLAEKTPPGECIVEATEGENLCLTTHFQLPAGHPVSAINLYLPEENNLSQVETHLLLIVDIPAHYLMHRMISQGNPNNEGVIRALDLSLQINLAEHFLESAMMLCNEVAAQFQCDRVSLGWSRGPYIEITAISHLERFDRKMEPLQDLNRLMEECFDQNSDLLWPQQEPLLIDRDHAAFARLYGINNLSSMPLRIQGTPHAVLSCERQEPFSEQEHQSIRVLLDQITPRLHTLWQQDRWIGAKLWIATRRLLSSFLGPTHIVEKLASIGAIALFLWLALGTWEYRIEAPFVTKGGDEVLISAPFDGYIQQVNHKLGDVVQYNQPIVSLKIDELQQREMDAIAEQKRYSQEVRKAQASRALAEVRIAKALETQVAARLKEIRNQLEKTRILSPIDGVIIEGDLEQMPDAPVKRGDILFKVATLDGLYFELEVDERDIQWVNQGGKGEVAFVGHPELSFPIHIDSINPSTAVQNNRNSFIAKASPVERAVWWRPGMSGIAKINAGERPLWWVLLHRTIDYLRLKLWI